MLCNICQDMFLAEVEDYKHYECGSTFRDLRLAAQSNCYVCHTLWQKMLGNGHSVRSDTNAKTVRRHISWNRIVTVDVKMEVGETEISVSQRFHLNPLSGLPYVFQEGPASANTASKNSIETASNWLQQCLREHVTCIQAVRASLKPPTRLLDVGAGINDKIFLIHPECGNPNLESSSPYYRYATMSHCWGLSPILTLTTKTDSVLAAGFELSILPPSFQHVVTICRSLGIKFLWIDSLCIYQDTDEDWNRECANMGAIYQGSVCTIAATAASNSQEGCFRQRPQCSVQPCIVQTASRKLPLGDYVLEVPAYWHYELEESPLLQRAWVFQERLLSTRVLHFAKTQIMWECLELAACEKYPVGISGILERNSHFDFRKETYTPLLKANTTDKPITAEQGNSKTTIVMGEVSTLWNNSVRQYSRGALTKPRDKLPAIGGVARLMTSLIGSEYLAGLWRVDLPYALLWYVEHGVQSNGQPSERPPSYRAPSWSWASIDGVVRDWAPRPKPDEPCPLDAELIDAHVQALTDDRFGQISKAYIRLRGLLRTVSIKRNLEPVLSFSNGHFSDGAVHIDCKSDIFGKSLHFMVIRSDEYMHGLILQPTGHRQGEFRRVGLAWVRKMHPDYTRTVETMENLKNDKWLEFEEFDGKSRYTITII